MRKEFEREMKVNGANAMKVGGAKKTMMGPARDMKV